MSRREEQEPEVEEVEDNMIHLLCCLDPAPFLRASPSPHVFISKHYVDVRGDHLELFSLYAKQFNPKVVCLAYPPSGYYFVYPNDYHPRGGDGHAQAWGLSRALENLLREKLELKPNEKTGVQLLTARSRMSAFRPTTIVPAPYPPFFSGMTPSCEILPDNVRFPQQLTNEDRAIKIHTNTTIDCFALEQLWVAIHLVRYRNSPSGPGWNISLRCIKAKKHDFLVSFENFMDRCLAREKFLDQLVAIKGWHLTEC